MEWPIACGDWRGGLVGRAKPLALLALRTNGEGGLGFGPSRHRLGYRRVDGMWPNACGVWRGGDPRILPRV